MTNEYRRDTAVKLLLRTRDRLEATGWQQFESGPREGPNCLTGALRWESPAEVTDDEVHSRAIEALQHAVVAKGLTRWNDQPGQDRGDIVLAIDRAIDYVKSNQ